MELRLLRDEVGIEPGPALRELDRHIPAGDVGDSASPAVGMLRVVPQFLAQDLRRDMVADHVVTRTSPNWPDRTKCPL
ncbi:hypothetical protein [Kibdelosporangium philippinense]|uniref:hypothetical protein n=1 Tax=Kibdelosporangium philippinense TaxID=211113 RepID=UPI0036D3EAC0